MHIIYLKVNNNRRQWSHCKQLWWYKFSLELESWQSSLSFYNIKCWLNLVKKLVSSLLVRASFWIFRCALAVTAKPSQHLLWFGTGWPASGTACVRSCIAQNKTFSWITSLHLEFFSETEVRRFHVIFNLFYITHTILHILLK